DGQGSRTAHMMSDDRAFTLSSCVVGNTSAGGGNRGHHGTAAPFVHAAGSTACVRSRRGLVREPEGVTPARCLCEQAAKNTEETHAEARSNGYSRRARRREHGRGPNEPERMQEVLAGALRRVHGGHGQRPIARDRQMLQPERRRGTKSLHSAGVERQE